MQTTPSNGARVPRAPIVSALIGNFMEFYDFAIFGTLAIPIGKLFFPSEDPALQLLSSLAVFGVTFLFRPIGGLIFGVMADRIGRKASLAASVIAMSITTTIIGVLPTYHSVGAIAPILLIVTRLLQGVSVGGEFTGSATFLGEFIAPGRRGFFASFLPASTPIGFAAGSAIVLVLTSTLGDDGILGFGWRIPFLIALPLGLIGLYMRLRLEETPVFKQLQKLENTKGSPFKRFTRQDFLSIGIVLVAVTAEGFGYFYFTTYFTSYLTATVGLSSLTSTTLSLISLVVFAGFILVAGRLSDRFGRKPVFISGALALGVLVVPIFFLLGQGVGGALAGLLVFGAAEACMIGLAPTITTELFPPETRATAGGLGYNLANAAAGLGPFIAAAIVARTGSPISPAWLLVGIEIVGGIALIWILPETSKRSLFAEPEADDAKAVEAAS